MEENKPTPGFIVTDGPGMTARAVLGPLITDAPVGLALVDVDFRFTFVNATFAALDEQPVEAHFEAGIADVVPPEVWEQLRPHVERALAGEPASQQEIAGVPRQGVTRHFLASFHPVRADKRSFTAVTGVCLVVSDITERKLSEALVGTQNRLLEGILAGVPLADTLEMLVQLIESQLRGIRCAVLLLDTASGRLQIGAAPHLPAAYRDLVEAAGGAPVGPDAGPAGRAAHLRRTVASDDLTEDGCGGVLASGGIHACRATPIVGDKGEILGVLALYTTGEVGPEPRDQELVQAAAYVARIAIERDREEARRRTLLRDMLLSLTDGRLRLCWSASDLPERLAESRVAPMPLSREALRVFRASVTEIAQTLEMPIERRFDLETAVGEAAMNAVVHAGGGIGEACADPATGAVQVWVTDAGPGIAEESLHRATLERGFTTAGTLGHGFWMILKTVDRIYLLTGPGGTTVVLEQDREPFEPDWLGVGGMPLLSPPPPPGSAAG